MAKMQNRIYSMDSAKAVKAQAFGWLNAIHYMAPASLSGVNLCPHASPACIAACLGWNSGQAGMVANDADINSVRASRIAKARRFMRTRHEYMRDMVDATIAAQRKAAKAGMRICVRLNGSTDIAWEGVRDADGLSIYARFSDVQFVDYTKSVRRAIAWAQGKLPSNLHLTFSRSETNEADCLAVLAAGGNVAIVFAGQKPATWHGYTVIDGDEHDLRHLDPRNVVVGLSPKGSKAKRDTSGFVVR